MTGLVLFAHGSSVGSANESVHSVARLLSERSGQLLVETAFLEAAKPDLADAIAALAAKGATRIIIVPYFLTLGIHLRRDLPRIVEGLRDIYKGVAIEVTEPLDGHPSLLQVVFDRAKDALNGGGNSESQVG